MTKEKEINESIEKMRFLLGEEFMNEKLRSFQAGQNSQKDKDLEIIKNLTLYKNDLNYIHRIHKNIEWDTIFLIRLREELTQKIKREK